MLVEAPVTAWAALLKTTRCPKCDAGGKSILLGRANVPEPEAAGGHLSDRERRAQWLNMHDNGLSSEAIADVMAGIPFDRSRAAHPHDGADFGRCYRLLVLYPEWRARLHLMQGVSPYWDALVPRWDEIEEAYKADMVTKRGETCYRLMRAILDPIEKADPRVIRLGGGMTMSFR
jgi:hypothetical protein